MQVACHYCCEWDISVGMGFRGKNPESKRERERKRTRTQEKSALRNTACNYSQGNCAGGYSIVPHKNADKPACPLFGMEGAR